MSKKELINYINGELQMLYMSLNVFDKNEKTYSKGYINGQIKTLEKLKKVLNHE